MIHELAEQMLQMVASNAAELKEIKRTLAMRIYNSAIREEMSHLSDESLSRADRPNLS